MIFKITDCKQIFVAIIIIITAICPQTWAQSIDLSADSALFAHYWNLYHGSQLEQARKNLEALSETDNELVAGMASYLTAVIAFDKSDYKGAISSLARGVPTQLEDHALALRARLLTAAGQQQAALDSWRKLRLNSQSVYFGEALIALATEWQELGEHDSVVQLVKSVDQKLPDESARELALLKALSEAALHDHSTAVEHLWNLVSVAPTTDQGKRARRELANYAEQYGFKPRKQKVSEIESELAAYARVPANVVGGNRVREVSESSESEKPVESLLYYGGLFAAQQKKYSEAIPELSLYVERYPQGRYMASALAQLGRAAYMRGNDSLAVRMLERLEHCSGDTTTICAGLETLTIMHMDRGHSHRAAAAANKWLDIAIGTSAKSDALWRLGWANWEDENYTESARAWSALSSLQDDSEYGPASRYWQSRALAKASRSADARSAMSELHQRYTQSYYAVISSDNSAFSSPAHRDLRPITLNELWLSGKPHAQKFALLATMRAVDDALDEWPAVKTELSLTDDWSFWKAQLYLWRGDRMTAYSIVRSDLGEYIRAAGQRPAAFSEIVYPLDYDPWIVEYCAENSLDPYFVCALICQESHYEPQISSTAGAIGLMQLMPATARIQARKMGIPFGVDDLTVPEKNLRIGIAHIADLMAEFNGDTVLVLAAYNAGKSAAQSWFEEFGDRDPDVFVEKIPYRETRLFVKRIIEHAAAYRRLYPELATVVPVSKQLNEPKP